MRSAVKFHSKVISRKVVVLAFNFYLVYLEFCSCMGRDLGWMVDRTVFFSFQ
jgi:hypothetical protein